MSFDEKVDVIDLIINVLKEHEKTLDDLISRLEEALSRGVSITPAEARPAKPSITVEVRNWMEFRERCRGSTLAAFDVEEGHFKVSALSGGILYLYEEEMPEMAIRFREEGERAIIDSIDLGAREQFPIAMSGRLNCGLAISVSGITVDLPEGASIYKLQYSIDPMRAKKWLSEELGVEEDRILEGEIRL